MKKGKHVNPRELKKEESYKVVNPRELKLRESYKYSKTINEKVTYLKISEEETKLTEKTRVSDSNYTCMACEEGLIILMLIRILILG